MEENVDDKDWKEVLTEEEYRVLREEGTEPRYSSDLINIKEEGDFTCKACGAVLFDSDYKFESGTGWPSFWDVHDSANIETRVDRKLVRARTEVICSNCESHLGHVFDDGPEPTGKRYCINGVALGFEPEEE